MSTFPSFEKIVRKSLHVENDFVCKIFSLDFRKYNKSIS